MKSNFNKNNTVFKNLCPQNQPQPSFFPKPDSSHDFKSLRDTDTSSLFQSQARTLSVTDFVQLRKLGVGKFGKVYLVMHKATGFLLALKIISKIELISKDPQETLKITNQFIRQIKIQSFLNHENLIKLYSFFSDEHNYYLLMELGCDGQLYQIIQNQGNFAESATSIIMREVVSGISYMHSNFVIHRDIKPENIVLIHGTAKICDFGWSVYCPKEVRSTLCGTPLYLSPEILKGNKYNEKSDIWALGTLCYEVLTNDSPFKIKRKEELSKIITEDFSIEEGSKTFQSFIKYILKKNPEQRPTAPQIQKHRFIKKYLELETDEELCRIKVKKKLAWLKPQKNKN